MAYGVDIDDIYGWKIENSAKAKTLIAVEKLHCTNCRGREREKTQELCRHTERNGLSHALTNIFYVEILHLSHVM
jgi:hypothetical protein